jgi:hypothetical protein
MNPHRLAVTLFALFVWSIHVTPARAGGWDLIYTDHFDLTWPDESAGIALGVNSFALLVNTSAEAMPLETVWANRFTVTSSRSDVSLSLGLNGDNPLGGPVQTGEAMGNVGTLTAVLLSQIRPDETLRNTAPLQFFFFQVHKGTGPVEGPAVFDVVWEMGGYVAHFSISAELRRGFPYDLAFPSAARVTAVPVATPARTTTWGMIKRLYR